MSDARSSVPDSDPAPPLPPSVSGDSASEADLSHLPEAHREVVRRLRRHVAQAADTIRRLRVENERLRRRVDELEAGPEVPEDETVVTFDDDPEALRSQIDAFIDAIDAYLETPSDGPSSSEDDSSS